jgi:hypothetical protein
MSTRAIDYGATYPNTQGLVVAKEYKSVDTET